MAVSAAEFVSGTNGSDTIPITGSGALVFAGDGNDRLLATDTSSGDNIIYGGRGNDDFTLGAGDTFFGGDGYDRFFVQTGGGNFITGGEEADQFWIAVAELPDVLPNNLNVITDFTSGEDVIGITGLEGVDSFEDLSLENIGTSESPSTLISVVEPDGTDLPLALVQGVELGNAADFVFADDDFFFTVQKSPLFVFEDGETDQVVEGSKAKLERFDDGVKVKINTQELLPGAYTVWTIVYNNPEECEGECDLSDVANEKVQAEGFWGTGGLVGPDAKGEFFARIREGEVPDGRDQVIFGEGIGLGDASKADIQFILRYHGPAAEEPLLLEEQLTQFNGGCAVDGNEGFPCEDVQSVTFPVNESYNPFHAMLG